MSEKKADLTEDERAANRRFKYTLIVFAVVEFLMIACAVAYKVTR